MNLLILSNASDSALALAASFSALHGVRVLFVENDFARASILRKRTIYVSMGNEVSYLVRLNVIHSSEFTREVKVDFDAGVVAGPWALSSLTKVFKSAGDALASDLAWISDEAVLAKIPVWPWQGDAQIRFGRTVSVAMGSDFVWEARKLDEWPPSHQRSILTWQKIAKHFQMLLSKKAEKKPTKTWVGAVESAQPHKNF